VTTPTRPPLDYDEAFREACASAFACDLLEVDTQHLRLCACYGWLMLLAERLECRPPTLAEAQEFCWRVEREF
jgi:hypothetical protein